MAVDSEPNERRNLPQEAETMGFGPVPTGGESTERGSAN